MLMTLKKRIGADKNGSTGFRAVVSREKISAG